MNTENTFNVTPQSTEVIAKVGDYEVLEYVLTLEKKKYISGDEIAYVSHRELLPSSKKEYILLEDAHRKTGISEKVLTNLCVEGVLIAEKLEGKWFINIQSLDDYDKRFGSS